MRAKSQQMLGKSQDKKSIFKYSLLRKNKAKMNSSKESAHFYERELLGPLSLSPSSFTACCNGCSMNAQAHKEPLMPHVLQTESFSLSSFVLFFGLCHAISRFSFNSIDDVTRMKVRQESPVVQAKGKRMSQDP